MVQGATAVERLTIYLSIGWFVRMLREESEISAWHGLMWLRRMILLIMVGYLKCSPYTDSPYGLLRSWRSLLTAGTLELLPKRPKAKRSLLTLICIKSCNDHNFGKIYQNLPKCCNLGKIGNLNFSVT